MSAVQAVSAAYYTSLAHNAAYSMIMNNMAMNSLVRNAGNISFAGGMRSLAAMENRLVMNNMNNSLQYRIAEMMLENQKKMQKKHSGLNLLA